MILTGIVEGRGGVIKGRGDIHVMKEGDKGRDKIHKEFQFLNIQTIPRMEPDNNGQ